MDIEQTIESCLAAIDADDYGSFIAVDRDRARADARLLAEELRTSGPRSALHGVPVAVKASTAVAGLPHTVGSGHRRELIAERDAVVVTRLREAGAIIIGTLNMHEWAWGITNANPYFGTPRNPAAPGYSPGGSSGGNAAAVAAGLLTMTVGADAAGSIRLPAAYCGIVGLKPSFGLVPTEGDYPLCPSLGHVGPMTKTVREARLLLEVLAGTSLPHSAGPFRLGVIEGQEVGLGMDEQTVRIPSFTAAPAACAVISLHEAATVHEKQLRENPGIYGEDVLTRLRAGQEITAADLEEAEKIRATLTQEFEAAFRRVDAILTRTTPAPAPLLGDAPSPGATRLLVASNLTGHPAITVPAGTVDGRPVGLQVIARTDAMALNVAEALENGF